MTDQRAITISKFVEMALSWTEQEAKTPGYKYLILVLCSMIGELLEERAERRTDNE